MTKIPAPNYTQSPNILFDETFKTLKEGELRVILVLMRQTFGWHKAFDRISLSQLADKSGMERSSVAKSLKTLIEKRLVIKKKFGEKGKEKCYFSLVIEETEPDKIYDDDDISEEEMDLISNNSYQCSKDTTPSVLKTLPQCSKDTHKRNSSKEINQNDDDDAHARMEKTKEKDPNILITIDSKGNEKSSCKIGIINYLRDNKYPEEIILEALIRTEKAEEPISNVLKYVETICLQIQSQNSKKPTYNQKQKGKPWKQSKYQHKQSSEREDMHHYKKQSQISKEKITELDTSEHPFQTWGSRLQTNKQP